MTVRNSAQMDMFAANDNTPTSKTCPKCGMEKSLSEFSAAKTGKFGVRSQCRACTAAYMLARYQRPDVRATKAARDARLAKDPEAKAQKSAYDKKRLSDPEVMARVSAAKRARSQSPEGKAKLHAYNAKRIRTDILYQCKRQMYSMLGHCVKITGRPRDKRTHETLGYTPDQLRQRLESQFKPGMNWSNRGIDGWHIDHKKPIIAFFRQGITDPRTINALCNLQPLWAAENMSKKDTWVPLVAANDNQKASVAA